MRLNKIQQAAVTALEDIKATDIVVLDTRTLTSLYDAIIVATAESARQTKALARNVQDKVRAAGGYVRAIEGEESGEWVLVDCGELVAHVMLPATRALYNLEELWTPTPTSKGAKTVKSTVKSSPKTTPIAQTNRAKTVDAVIDSAPIAKAKPASKSTSSATASKKKPASKTPAAKKPVAKKPAAKKPVAKTPSSKRPAAKKPAAKKPAAKRPAAKKPATKKRA